MRSEQPSFTDVEYGNRRRVLGRERFLESMDAVIPWTEWVALIEPFTYCDAPGKRGRKAKPVQTMLRMYLLQVWFWLSDEGTEDAVYDSYAMRAFLGLDFAVEQAPDATTLLHVRHLMEQHDLGERLLASQAEIFAEQGWIMRGGSIVDATIIAAPPSTKNASGARDPQMHQTKKGNQWTFGMKAQIGVDASTGYVHSVTATAANVHDLDQVTHLVRDDDEVVYADAGYQGVDKRPDVTSDPNLWKVRFKVEHPFLITVFLTIKRDFRFTKTRYRGLAKNRNHLNMLFASASWLMRAPALTTGVPLTTT
ncbi:MAG: IS5 family transposase [Actinomycetales bacterium]